MLTLQPTAQYKKDRKRAMKQGLQIELLDDVIEDLVKEKNLDPKYRDHALTGKYKGFRECHVLPDWLFIYAIEKKKLILIASRTGTHSELF